MEKHSLVRTIYLYLFAILGLVLLIIGGVGFIDMGLKAFVFTEAEKEQRLNYKQPSSIPYSIQKIEKLQDEEELSEEEKTTIKQWLADYKEWKEKQSEIDPVTARRHRNASSNLAKILIGLPLYFYHWGIIKREVNKQEKRENRE